MDMVLQTAGAAVLSVPSNEIYAAMQTGACDAGITSSTSLISFRLEEVSKSLTSGARASYWFMLEPLMMSKSIFDGLPKNQQDIILAVGAELEAFGTKGAQDDDVEVAKVYEKAGAKVSALDAATVGKWRDIARDTAWKDYGAKTATAANLLEARVRRLRMMHGPLPDRQDIRDGRARAIGLVAAFERALALCNNVIVVLRRAGAGRGLRHPELQRARPRAVPQPQLLAGRGGGVSAGRRHLHDGGLCAGPARPYRHRGLRRPAVAAGQPHPAVAGRRREPAVLRVLRLEILDAGP